MLIIVLASVYPIFMGVVIQCGYMKNGLIHVEDYQKYIIPYTPICIALILSTSLLPLIFILCRRYTLPAVSLLGTIIFFITEYFYEQIRVIGGANEMPLESWQYGIPFSAADIVIVLASGVITYFVMKLLKNAHTSNKFT
jgi:hypothetical protein